jgi:hypothetical protein
VHRWIGNQVIRLAEEEKKRDFWKRSSKPCGEYKNKNSPQDDKY